MNICVFCSSSNALAEIFFIEARALGKLMVDGDHTLVYGGSNVGLMHELARTIKEQEGSVIGVIPERIKDKGLATTIADELIVTADMSERKKLMGEKSEAFVALPGGFGTLEEIMEVITLKQLQYHNKPIVFVNTNGFYNKLLDFFEVFYENNFAKPDYKEYFVLVDTAAEAINYIENYTPPDFKDKWYWVGADEFKKK